MRLALRVLRDDAWKVLAYTAVLLVNVLATIGAYPTFKAEYQVLVNFVPDWARFVKDALMMAGEGRFTVFVALNHFFKGANVIGPTAAIVLALGTIVREVEIGTIGLLLSRPLSRTRVLCSFALVHLAELLVPLFLVSAAIPWLAQRMIGETVPLTPMLWSAAHACAFVAAIYALALLLAVLLVEQLRVVAIAGGICVVSFLLYFLEPLRPFTLYALSSIDAYLETAQRGAGRPAEMLGCALLALVLLVTALLVFRRRDY